MIQGSWAHSIAGVVVCTLLAPVMAGAGVPQGPLVVISPESGKPPDLFAAEQDYCRSDASASVDPGESEGSVMRSAVVGTLLGAVAGSVFSGRHHDNTAIGAVAGLAMGAAAGSNEQAVEDANAQRRFDAAYTQCMLAKGNGTPHVVYRPAQSMVGPAPSGVPPDYSVPNAPPDYSVPNAPPDYMVPPPPAR